jgi:hypothetical protein
MSYFEQRMQELGVTDQDLEIKLISFDLDRGDFPVTIKSTSIKLV